MYDIYEKCPIFQNETVTLELIKKEDAKELLNCYSDEKAAPLFNADNCDNEFYMTTLNQMEKMVDTWIYSYKNRWYVRLTVTLNATGEKIGTVEMFNRGKLLNLESHGILRIDLMSKYEKEEVIQGILDLATRYFYQDFGVDWMVTKAVSEANTRIEVLKQYGFISVENFGIKDYYARRNV